MIVSIFSSTLLYSFVNFLQSPFSVKDAQLYTYAEPLTKRLVLLPESVEQEPLLTPGLLGS